jgi:O-methyltransferase involved in polyketide biosynthesis
MIEDPQFPESTSDINASNYKLFSCDVRKTDELGSLLVDTYGVDRTAPTLILTECLLVYLV